MAEKDLKLNEAIAQVALELQKSNIKKSGKNKFAGFDYFELSDFLPKLTELEAKYGINDRISFEDSYAQLELIKGDEKQIYKIPFERFATPLNKNGTPTMQDIQYLGALTTYYKRYLYMNAFRITDGEIIDGIDNANLQPGIRKATKDQLNAISELVEDVPKMLSWYHVAALSDLSYDQANEIIKIKRAKENGTEKTA